MKEEAAALAATNPGLPYSSLAAEVAIMIREDVYRIQAETGLSLDWARVEFTRRLHDATYGPLGFVKGPTGPTSPAWDDLNPALAARLEAQKAALRPEI